jgi:uncharacterized iron-regulated protein
MSAHCHTDIKQTIVRAFASALLLAAVWSAPDVMAADAAPWERWTTKLHAGSAAIGLHAADGKGQTAIGPDKLIETLAAADYVLLGEIHDNPDHHRLQAWIIDQLAARGRKPVAVVEMIDAGQEDALRSYLLKDGAGAEGLGAALEWEKHGWPTWGMYQPVAEAALKAGGKEAILSAGGPARDAVRAVSRGGLDAALPRPDQERMGLTKELPEALADDLKEELFEDHCKLMPKEAMAPLVNIQRLRDATFADRLLAAHLAASTPRSVVLIAGGGHVRKDRGAPYYLAARDPAAKMAVVMFAEADGETKSADDIKTSSADGAPKADFIWVTPAAEREDQCEKLRKHMNQKK